MASEDGGANVERFLERFAAFGAEPSAERYEDLFDPLEGEVLHPGMTAPLHRDLVREYMAAYLATVPGFRFEIVRWAEQGGVVFVEARNEGRPGGEKLAWPSVYRIVLRGDRVLSGQAFLDRVPLLAALVPDATLESVAGAGAVAPGPPAVGGCAERRTAACTPSPATDLRGSGTRADRPWHHGCTGGRAASAAGRVRPARRSRRAA